MKDDKKKECDSLWELDILSNSVTLIVIHPLKLEDNDT